MRLADALNQIKAKQHERLADRAAEKYSKTKKNKYFRSASDHYDKAEDLNLLATAPHSSKKEAKKYIQDRRDKIDTNKLNDYLKNGVGKEYYED